MAERKKYDYEDSRLKAQKFVRYKEGCKLYAMGMSKFQEIAKEAGAIYKINQMVLVNEAVCRVYVLVPGQFHTGGCLVDQRPDFCGNLNHTVSSSFTL